MSITFTKSTTTITLPDPASGGKLLRLERQATGRTAGGTLYAYDKGVGRVEAELVLESLTDSEKDALTGFFQTTVRGCRDTFTYTDSGSATHTARFVTPQLEWTEVSANVWDTRVRLELS